MQILIADKRVAVRSALRLLLEQETTFTILATVANAVDLQRQLAQSHVDLLLLDWELPGCSPTFLANLVSRYTATAVIVLSSQPEAMPETIANGAAAFISKNEAPQYVLNVIQSVAQQLSEANPLSS